MSLPEEVSEIMSPPQSKLMRIYAGSQNGYLFSWNLNEYGPWAKMKYAYKLFNGSIEGLHIRNNQGLICSSDCTFSLMNQSHYFEHF
jgi:hypothetical protein